MMDVVAGSLIAEIFGIRPKMYSFEMLLTNPDGVTERFDKHFVKGISGGGTAIPYPSGSRSTPQPKRELNAQSPNRVPATPAQRHRAIIFPSSHVTDQICTRPD